MATVFGRSSQKEHRARSARNWRSIASCVIRVIAIALMVLTVIALLTSSGANQASQLSAVLCVAAIITSFAYLLVVAHGVHMSFFDLDELIKEHTKDQSNKSVSQSETKEEGLFKSTKGMLAHGSEKDESLDEAITLQVTRLDSSASFATVVNESWLPVLHGELGFVMSSLDEGHTAQPDRATRITRSDPFCLPARSSLPDVSANAFNHVGIFRLHSDGVRIYDLFGILSKTSGPAGNWRVRVVPNIYRLTRGIAESRKTSQVKEGIPDTPMDALDYDRVRDYRPGDSLRKIHWKLVAHRQGELYTKLFEDSRFSTVTLLIDPYGADVNTITPEHAFHLHDTMLEGGFSLIEHARENGLLGQLRFVTRHGRTVESSWEGRASLGWFVEVAQRPESSPEALNQSVMAIRSLADRSAGYTIFATSRLSARSVQELIAVHHSGIPLLVVHAIPNQNSAESSQQRAFDERLRAASIPVISLTDGQQIVREVA